MDSGMYDARSDGTSAWCGQQLQVTNTATGASVVVIVADECPTCNNAQSLDLSKAAFEALADLSVGMINIEYKVLT
jgi:rare lipoprotein A (peptidoglycan hydrolase)